MQDRPSGNARVLLIGWHRARRLRDQGLGPGARADGRLEARTAGAQAITDVFSGLALRLPPMPDDSDGCEKYSKHQSHAALDDDGQHVHSNASGHHTRHESGPGEPHYPDEGEHQSTSLQPPPRGGAAEVIDPLGGERESGVRVVARAELEQRRGEWGRTGGPDRRLVGGELGELRVAPLKAMQRRNEEQRLGEDPGGEQTQRVAAEDMVAFVSEDGS